MIAICLGGAKTVWDEFASAKVLVGDRPHIVVACNFAGIEYAGHLDVWVTLHPEWFEAWKAERAASGRNSDYRAFVYTARKGGSGEVVAYRWYGSSGLYMAQVALEECGANGAIMCGVPMDDTGGHIRHGDTWNDSRLYRAAWFRAKDAGMNVRSMSGWTAEKFGAPNDNWIEACYGT